MHSRPTSFARFTVLFLAASVLLLLPPGTAQAAPQSVAKTLSVPWSLDDKPPPKEYWTPWAPVPTYAVVRYAIGFRASTGSVNVNAPFAVSLSYDDA